jgi:hypothetical protein
MGSVIGLAPLAVTTATLRVIGQVILVAEPRFLKEEWALVPRFSIYSRGAPRHSYVYFLFSVLKFYITKEMYLQKVTQKPPQLRLEMWICRFLHSMQI